MCSPVERYLCFIFFFFMNFAVPVKMVFVNDNDNRCISGVFG